MGPINRYIYPAAFFVLATILFVPQAVHSIGYPHYLQNEIECQSCHDAHHSGEDDLMPVWTIHEPQNIDDTQKRTLCWSCHCAGDSDTCYETHSSRQTDDSYGHWTVDCVVCHEPHYQMQAYTYTSDYVYTGTVDLSGVTATTLTVTGAGWEEDAFVGMTLIPNMMYDVVNENYPYVLFSYKIVGNTADTLTVDPNVATPEVDGSMNLALIYDNEPFAVSYGQLIRTGVRPINLGRIALYSSTDLPLPEPTYPKSGTKEPKFIRPEGDNSFSDGDSTYDGICEVCHTQTTHFRNDGSGEDQLHGNVGNPAREKCTRCHSHANGFMHGSGSSGCSQCHGHDAGSDYDLDMQFPNDELDGQSMGAGSSWSHSTHTENDSSGHSDLMGPMLDDGGELKPVYCDTCHDTTSMPLFKNQDGSGGHTLAATDICDNCHSPLGTYNGVNSVTGSIGAKDNWHTGVYNEDRTLQPGKEKWCAGCHDEDPANTMVDGSGFEAPNIVGDEDGSFRYGTGWGFYKTGHGVPDYETYPASGGITDGAGRICSECHDQTTAHLDGDSRTFDCDDSTGGACSAAYQASYRLISVGGNLPMQIPQTGRNLASFRLCFSCHTNTDDWLSADNNYRDQTNFYDVNQSPGKKNLHIYHLGASKSSELDWDAGFDGDMSCITCHNVHGSTNPVMIRSGDLTEWPPMDVYYGNDCSTHTAGQNAPVPDDITLAVSTKSTMRGLMADPYCSHCHGSGTNIVTVARTPIGVVDRAPELNWVGGPAYESDGVDPDAAPSGTEFTFKVEYSDVNQDGPPDTIQLWIDRNGDGDYEDPDEKIGMVPAFAETDTCAPYNTGFDYVTTATLDKLLLGGGSTVTYKFYAVYGGMEATGPPTYESTLTLFNDAPMLDWTGESGYESDGVVPDYGPQNGTYSFRVKYIDDDGDACPASDSDAIQVWIDLDGSSTYDAGEQFNLTEDSAADIDCTTADGGKLYYTDQVLPNSSGGSLTYAYRFYATDGTDDATGEPVAPGGSVTVAATGNNPPLLAWDSGTCRPQGARPPRSAPSSIINFAVRYYDEDNQCPAGGTAAIQVWVDLDNSGGYSAGEQINLEETDADTDCTIAGGGKLYAVDVTPATVADDITYEFHATDGTDEALGEPRTTGGMVDVIAADRVVRQDGTEDYTTISAAITASASGDTILVYDGTYNESVSKGAGIYYNMNLNSACGPEETIISNSNDPVVYVYRGGSSIIDGFTVTGSSGTGVRAAGDDYDITDSELTVSNCIIRDNSGRGIAGSRARTIIRDCEIYGNLGGGIESYAGTVTDTVIRNNSVTGNGGGIASASENGSFTLTNVTIKDNTATGNGGGIYCRHSSDSSYAPAYEKVTLSGNSSDGTGGGGYFTWCSPTFTNTLLSDNSAVNGGGIGISTASIARFVSSTIVNNNASGDGGGYYTNGLGNTVHLANSIAWGNRAGGAGHIGRFAQTSGSVMDADLYDSVIENNGDDDITDDNYFSSTVYVNVNDTGTNYDTDPNFVNSAADGDYHLLPPSDAIDNAADNSGSGIPADDLEGNTRPSGSEDIGAYEYLWGGGDALPVLSWTGQPGFAGDGVDPDAGAGGADYEFRIEYSHADNVAPDPIEVWIDQNGNDTYESNEKYPMTTLVSGDTFDDGDYANGERYTAAIAVYKDGGGYVNYRFYASDGRDVASGEPTITHTFYVDNAAPVLAWAGDADYESDGVNPDEAAPGSSFVFRVLYTDPDNFDNDALSNAQVWIDLDDDGSYESGSELFALAPEAGADAYHDGNFANGEIFASSPITLDFAGDGIFTYRFYFADGADVATGPPVTNHTVSLTNTAPALSWTGETNFSTDGVDPDTGGSGDSFEFRVDYTDANNTAPSAIQVWIDVDDSGTYETGEKFTLTEVDSGDTTYDNGKRYSLTRNIAYTGDGIIMYRFYASDGRDEATGDSATAGGTFEVAEGMVHVNFTAAAQATADETAASYTITAQLDAVIFDDVTVPFTVTGTAAGGGTDYTITTNPITITAGQLSADITVTVAADSLDEDDETVIVTMGTPTNAIKGTVDVHTLTITDDDAEPGVTFTSASQTTADESGDYTITAQLSTVSGRQVSVPYSLGGDAVENTDYTVSPNPLIIPAGDDAEDITVSIVPDSDYEGNETVAVTMGVPTNATQGATTVHNLTITDDDGSPILRTVACTAPDPIGDYQYVAIQDAINAAFSGETVLVCDGTYSENINFGGKNITVQSLNGAAVTTIQGDGTTNAPVVTFNTAETSNAVLDGFTIDNQTAANSLTRGIAISGNAAPTLKNLVVQGNNTITTWVQGAGIYIDGGTATIETSTIGNATLINDCQNGCGIYATGLTGNLSISGTTIQYHNANNGAAIYLTANGTYTITLTDNSTVDNNIGATGGGMYIDASRVAISGSTFSSNSSSYAGGAIYATGSATTLAVSSTDFIGNAAGSGQDGGAIYFTGSTESIPFSITGGTFNSNSAGDIGGTIYLAGTTNPSTVANATISTSSAANGGGAIYTSSPLTMTDTAITGTTVTSSNDAFRADGTAALVDITNGSISNSSGMGLRVQNGAVVTVTGTTINSNGGTNIPNNGGGISITTSGPATSLTLDKVYLEGNQANNLGGGIYIGGGTSATLTNTLIGGNAANNDWQHGGGIRNEGTLYVYNSTFAGNYAAVGGGLSNIGTATIINSIFWDNVAGRNTPEIFNSGSIGVTYSDIEVSPVYTGTGNINLDPLFVTPAQAGSGSPTTAGDFHIQPGSNVIDQGTATGAPADDIDGDVRDDGSPDMGADEIP